MIHIAVSIVREIRPSAHDATTMNFIVNVAQANQ